MRFAAAGIIVASTIGVIATSPACRAEAPQETRVAPQNAGLDEFSRRADEYAEWRRRLARPLGDIDETKSPKEISDREAAIGQAIRKERVTAKPGDIFAPAAASIIKDRIRAIYKSSPQVRDTRQDAEVEVPDFVPEVNMVYPTTFPLATFPPTILKELPELPKELEYRIVTHHLILRDTEANTIVDVLPNAVP